MKKMAIASVIFLLCTAATTGYYPSEPLSWDGWAWGTPLVSVATSLAGYGNFTPVEGALIMINPNNKLEVFANGPTIFQKFVLDKFYIFLDGKFAGIRLAKQVKGEKEMDEVMKYLVNTYSSLKEDYISTDGKRSYSLWEGAYSSILCEDNRLTRRPVVYFGTTLLVKALLAHLLEEGYMEW